MLTNEEHERCIAEIEALFDLALEQALTRAEQAERERDALQAECQRLKAEQG